jgi:hypothetical protein
MKANIPSFFTVLLALAFTVRADDSQFQSTTGPTPAPKWSPGAILWPGPNAEKPLPPLRLPRTDFRVSGPLIDAFRPRPEAPDQNRLQRFLSLPVIRLAVPQPMASPPGGTGRYFAWKGPSSQPWANVSAGIPPGQAVSPINNPTRSALISVSH